MRTADDGQVTEFVEKPAVDQIDTRNISAGAYVLERSVLDMLTPDQPASIERDVFPQLVGNGLYGCVSDDYWLDIGTPERYLEATFDILEGTVGTAFGERTGGAYLVVEQSVDNRGRIIPSALVESGCVIGDGARVGGRVVLEAGVMVGANSTIERAVVLRGAEIGENCTPGRLHRRRRRADRRQHACRGHVRARRGRHDRRRQRDRQRGPDLTGRRAAGRRDPVLVERRRSTAPRWPRSIRRPRSPTSSVCADHLLDALWRVEAANLRPVDTPGGLVIVGMGGSGVGGALARAALRPQLDAPARAGARRVAPRLGGPETLVLCSSYSGNTEETLAAYDAAGAAGAPRVVSASGGELAARARRDGVPVVPLPGGFQPRAAVGYAFVVALELGRARRRRAVGARRGRGAPPSSRAGSPPSGAPTGTRTARPRRWRGASTAPCR